MSEAANTTRVSTRGQVVIPQSVRSALHLQEGELLAVYGEGDTIILKRISAPAVEEMKAILAKGGRFAKERKLSRRDVARAIRDARSEG
jgi:AbrB family looped-hinge helix DNA binding protein